MASIYDQPFYTNLPVNQQKKKSPQFAIHLKLLITCVHMLLPVLLQSHFWGVEPCDREATRPGEPSYSAICPPIKKPCSFQWACLINSRHCGEHKGSCVNISVTCNTCPHLSVCTCAWMCRVTQHLYRTYPEGESWSLMSHCGTWNQTRPPVTLVIRLRCC